jgi:hypothetical protein
MKVFGMQTRGEKNVRIMFSVEKQLQAKSTCALRPGMKKNSNEHNEIDTNSRHRSSF